MKIVVLAGGLSTERQVSLVTGSSVCRALRSRGHQAILVDMFLGLEGYEGALADIFDAPDGLLGSAAIEGTAPDLDAVRRGRADQALEQYVALASTAPAARMAGCRRPSTFWASPTPGPGT